ncbi:MAG: hypothetical protein COV34_01330 [Candidatus Zambryskibacteria bacterium CG10_big_fil_rev_8_21_14_0_10_42_12]|uniref:Uncharacterized protein n=1 Tax=Candidatus Zambryskibacteria bacterium CG10_big_fil_rev_8_21_14_0_10_42_12 TaxID=1975115 RepID=A0A2H0QVD1_9BACT|nr:MAG: hypothetical protein COV34_01330 [Candidatus Zambryskibacteria bacterium CG10_big_fil_rev_8_21_14_0_10_42_12]
MKFLNIAVTTLITASPLLLYAQEQDAMRGEITDERCEGFSCDYGDLINLIQDILLFMLKLSIPIAAIALAVAGFKILTARDSVTERSEAKTMMLKIVGGVMIMLAAGLIVNTIVGALLQGDFNFLD